MRLLLFSYVLLASISTAFAQTQDQRCELYSQQFSIYLDSQSIEISDFAQAVIDQAVANISDAPDFCEIATIQIDSHTDTAGSEKRNLYLSQAIAQNVVDLFSELGFSDADMIVTAHGESQPQKSTRDGVREPRNRRTDINMTVAPK